MPNDGSSLGLSCTRSALKQIRLDYTVIHIHKIDNAASHQLGSGLVFSRP